MYIHAFYSTCEVFGKPWEVDYDAGMWGGLQG